MGFLSFWKVIITCKLCVIYVREYRDLTGLGYAYMADMDYVWYLRNTIKLNYLLTGLAVELLPSNLFTCDVFFRVNNAWNEGSWFMERPHYCYFYFTASKQ